jgi:WD40 repeat protein
VANVFISHSSADIGWAREIYGWLKDDHHEVFLDQHHQDGIPAGDDWRQRLNERLRWADAVVCVVTPSFVKSAWCAAEVGAAYVLGSEILPARASAEQVDATLLDLKQFVDVVHDADGARERLRSRLDIVDGGGGRGWPDGKSPYPGLRAFDLGDHSVFFGRTREIKEVTERLRSPTQRSARAVLTVVGSSGCGKSSLVRAGVRPRLAGAQDWLTIPPMLPRSDPVGNLARSLAAAANDRRIDLPTGSIREDLERDGLTKLATNFLIAAGVDAQCKLLIVIDQFEELMTQTGPDQRSRFAEILGQALGGPVQALATMRSEFLDNASKDPALSQIALPVYQVRPLQSEALRSVIEEPAAIAGLDFDDDLVATLVAETGGGDALPLLAYTLEQLAHDVKRGGRLTHQRYVEIGGVSGALQSQADAALEDACGTVGVTAQDVVSELLDMVNIDDQAGRTKRVVPLEDLSTTTVAKLQPFVDRRLLSTYRDGDRSFVTVAHEAFLVYWPPLKREIDSEATALRARRAIESAAKAWVAGGHDKADLLQRRQLAKAAVEIGAPSNDQTLNPAALLGRAKRLFGHGRLDYRVELDETGRRFLDASVRADRLRRLRAAAAVISLIVVLALITSFALRNAADANRSQAEAETNLQAATAQKLNAQAQGILAGTTPGGDVQALQKLIAAHTLADDVDAGGLIGAAMQRITTFKIIDTGIDIDEIAFSPNGQRVANVSVDRTVRLWNAQNGQPVGAPLTDILGVAFSPDGSSLFGAGLDGTLRRWNADSGDLIGGMVQLWNANTGQPVDAPHTGQTAPVYTVAFSLDGHRLATVGEDQTMRLWNADTGQPIGDPFVGETGGVMSLAFSPDGRRLASASNDGAVRLWDAESRRSIGDPLRGHQSFVFSVAFSPDGHRLASGGIDGTVRLWDAQTREPIRELEGHTNYVSSVAFSRDGRRLASASFDRTVQLWDTETGQPVGAPLRGHTDTPRSVAFSPDGRRLASGGDDAMVRLWNLDVGLRLTGHTAQVNSVAFSLDGTRLASASSDATVRVWDAGTGQPIGAPLAGHTGAVTTVAFSPDGHRLASGGTDKTVRMWNIDTAKTTEPLTGHTEAVTSIAFSPDGHRLVSGSDDGTVQLWNADTGAPLGGPLTGDAERVFSVAFSSDGKRVASAGFPNHWWLWTADTTSPPLTPSEFAHHAPITQPRRAPPGQRQPRQDAADVERRHRRAARRPADQPHRSREQCGV